MKRATRNAPNSLIGTSVVLGASMAGLAAARVLAERSRHVIVIDRDTLPDGPEARRSVPQGRHPHVLLPAGARLLETWLPGLGDDLRAAGAVDIDLCADFAWYQRGGLQRRPQSGLRAPAMSRPLLEWHVRRRVAALRNVEFRPNTAAVGLLTDNDAARVTGVELASGQIDCDLVVDATGRQAHTLAWLKRIGYTPPPTSVVEVDVRYVTRVFHRVDDERDWHAAAVLDDPSAKRLAMLLPMEGDRWIVGIAGVNGEAAPTGDTATLDYLRSFETSLIADTLTRCEPLGETVTHRFPANQRRHVERLRRFPTGWLLLGDAVCSFNPIYGQGMSSAVLQAEALGAALDRAGRVDTALARSYFRAAAKIVSAPWSITVGGDFVYGGTRGRKPVGTDLLNRYLERVVDAGRRDDSVVVRLNEVIALVRSPHALLTPSFVLRVLRTAHRVDRDAARTPNHSRSGLAHPESRHNAADAEAAVMRSVDRRAVERTPPSTSCSAAI